MHQWKENKRTVHNHDYFSYEMTWSENFIDSTSFHGDLSLSFFEDLSHRNIKTNFVRRSDEILSKNFHIGQYFLSDELKKMAKNRKEFTITEETLQTADTGFMRNLQAAIAAGEVTDDGTLINGMSGG